MKTKTNKENRDQITTKKGATFEGDNSLKAREFGTEITNKAEVSSECEIDEKSP